MGLILCLVFLNIYNSFELCIMYFHLIYPVTKLPHQTASSLFTRFCVLFVHFFKHIKYSLWSTYTLRYVAFLQSMINLSAATFLRMMILSPSSYQLAKDAWLGMEFYDHLYSPCWDFI